MLSDMLQVDWERMFVPDTPILEIILRGTLVYLAVFFLLRIVLKRESGSIGIADLLVVVMLADATQNAMADGYHSVSNGIILVATIIFWSYALSWLAYHFPLINRLVHPAPLILIKEGRMLRRNMRKELITPDELQSMLREEGIDDLSKVKEAYLEQDGRLSVITYEGRHRTPQKQPI